MIVRVLSLVYSLDNSPDVIVAGELLLFKKLALNLYLFRYVYSLRMFPRSFTLSFVVILTYRDYDNGQNIRYTFTQRKN